MLWKKEWKKIDKEMVLMNMVATEQYWSDSSVNGESLMMCTLSSRGKWKEWGQTFSLFYKLLGCLDIFKEHALSSSFLEYQQLNKTILNENQVAQFLKFGRMKTQILNSFLHHLFP